MLLKHIPTRNSIKSIGYASGSDQLNSINIIDLCIEKYAVAFNILELLTE